jgi:SH3-like domain-containing protein
MSKWMRTGAAALLAGFFAMTALEGVADAETLVTTGRTALRARPGEQARIVVRVDAGEPVRVIERDGRWIQVEYKGQTGWVTRTSVRAGAERAQPERRQRQPRRDRQPPRTRADDSDERRSSFGRRAEDDDEAMRLVVTAERARLYRAPERGSAAAAAVSQGDDLRVLEQSEEWFRVRGPGGKEGWILRSAVGDPSVLEGARETAEAQAEAGIEPDIAPGAAVMEDDEEPEVEIVGPSVPGEPRELELRVGIGAGATALALDYANDSVSGFASGIALSGSATYPIGGALFVGADIRYLAQLGLSDLSYDAAGTSIESSSFLLYDFDVGARACYALGDALGAWARVGFIYGALYTRDLPNAARFPREELAGLTAGIGVDTAIANAIDLELAASAMLLGTHRQTVGLQDGAELSGQNALWASLGARYALSDSGAIDFHYRLGRQVLDWTGASTRAPDEANTTRTDLSHQLIFGYAASF